MNNIISDTNGKFELIEANIKLNDPDKLEDIATLKLNLKQFTIKSISTGKIWEYNVIGEYLYTLSSWRASSEKYGKCQCCGQYADSIYYQVESKYFKVEHDGKIYEGYTRHNCKNLVGHKDCLLKARGL